MKKTLGIAVLLSVGASGLAVAQKKPASHTPVTTVISDYDSGVAPALQIQSDQLGAYANSSTQKSLILANGDWRLDAYHLTGATRTVFVSFSHPIPGTGPNGGAPVAPPSGHYTVNLGSNCSNAGNSMLTLAPGQTMQCPMNVHFDYGGKIYDLHMSQNNVNFPETQSSNVTCIFPTTGTNPCSQWRLWPSGTYLAPDGTTQQRNVANLSYETTVKGKMVYVKQGNFYISFSIIVTNP